MDIAGIIFPRSVQEILYDYQQDILKSEIREPSGESYTPRGTSQKRPQGVAIWFNRTSVLQSMGRNHCHVPGGLPTQWLRQPEGEPS